MNDLLLIANIAGRRCAFCAVSIRSVVELGTITPVPGAPPAIIGLTALRSKALTVVDCRIAIGEATDGHPTDVRAAVVDIGGHSYALLVDRVEDIAATTSEVDTVLGGFGDQWVNIAHGMVETAEGPVLLLDLAKLIALPAPTHRAA